MAKIEDRPMRAGRCGKHGLTDFFFIGKRYGKYDMYICLPCYKQKHPRKKQSPEQIKQKDNARSRVRRAVKRQVIIDHFGGKCVLCGYGKSAAALHFHHRDASAKMFQIAHREMYRPIEEIIAEASKCDLICANCHCELHFVEGTMGPRKRLNPLSDTHQERNT